MTVLSDSSVAEYKTADYPCGSSAPFLRSLHSSAFTGPAACRSLEQPNIVTGLPAAGTAHSVHPECQAAVYGGVQGCGEIQL